MKTLAIFIIALLTVNSCNEKVLHESNSIILEVNSAKVPCEGVGTKQCLEVRKGESTQTDPWQLFYAEIGGFNFEPGYVYKLKVSEEKIDRENLPADASSIKYKLIEVLSKVSVSENINYRLHDIWALEAINGEILKRDVFSKNLRRPVLEIFVKEMRIGGNDSCNEIFGSIDTLDDKTIGFKKMGSTMMACPKMELSASYTKALTDTRTYKLKGLSLFFYNEDDREILLFRKID